MKMKYENSYLSQKLQKRSIETIDSFIIQYLNTARKKREIKGLQNLFYHFEYSNKSDSCYLILNYQLNERLYSKTLRISDHKLKYYHGREFIISEEKNYWDKNIKKNLQQFIKKEITSFYKRTNLYVIKSAFY